MSDREPFEQARTAGLRARHETREARAIRKQVAEEIAQAFEDYERRWDAAYRAHGRDADLISAGTANMCARIAREIGAKE